MSVELDGDAYPLSPMQEGMLFDHLAGATPGVDLAQIVCTLREDVRPEVLERAWRRLMARHPVLRTRLEWEGRAEPVQRVLPEVDPPLAVRDWSGLDAGERRARLEELLRAERRAGLDLRRAPLFRVTLIRLGPAEHVLVVPMHHVVLDGRSLLIVLRELFALVDADREGGEAVLPARRPYRDFVEWLRGRDASGDEEHWRALLDGFTAPTPLPAAPPVAGPTGEAAEHAEQDLELPAGLSAALRDLAGRHGLTLNTLLQAAWALLLARYTGRSDVVFGATRSCRQGTVDGADEMVGLFINTLPVRVRVEPDLRLGPWLAALRAQGLAVREHQHTPLFQVQRWSGVPVGTPLFETTVTFENFLLDGLLRRQGGAWLGRSVSLRRQPAFPLLLYGFGEERLLLKLISDPARFPAGSIVRMLRHLRELLAGMAMADPDRRLGDLPMLGEDERRALTRGWNATERPYPPVLAHELFEARCRRIPGAPAVRPGRRCVTYRQLNERANRLAWLLRRLGVGPEVRVGVCLERSPELVTAALAVSKAGGASVPLDADAPAEHLARVLADARAPVALTNRRLAERLRAPGLRVVRVEDADAPGPDLETAGPAALAVAANAAYVIYTSGSTGRPKGVVCQHAGLVSLVDWQVEQLQLSGSDRTTLLANPGFDLSVWEVWTALASGACLHVPDEETRLDPARLAAWLVERRITMTHLPTGLAEAVLEQRWPEGGALRALLLGGDRLRRPVPSGLPFAVHQFYGPTEATVLATGARLDGGAGSDGPAPIGRPVANARVHLLGPDLELAPVGAVAELFIGGHGLARGYLGSSDLTAERFLPDPFAETPGERLYRTGDLARRREDGSLEFAGRVDDQVKIRGFRVEPGEVEAVLGRHPRVQRAVVVAREDARGDRWLAAYAVPAPGPAPDAAELRGFLRARLPGHMVPRTVALLEALPLTPNGKVDRRALPDPTAAGGPAGRVAPRGPGERAMAAIWADVLGLAGPDPAAAVGAHDSFFELGGHSLLATQLALRVRESMGARIELRDVFDAPTVAALTALIESRTDGEAHDALSSPTHQDGRC